MSRPSRDCDLRRSDRLAKSNGITKSSSAPTLLVAITRDIATAVPSRTAIAHSPCQFPLPNYATPDFLAPHSSTGADMYVASYSCEVIFAAIRRASVGGPVPEARLRCHHRLFREEKNWVARHSSRPRPRPSAARRGAARRGAPRVTSSRKAAKYDVDVGSHQSESRVIVGTPCHLTSLIQCKRQRRRETMTDRVFMQRAARSVEFKAWDYY